MVASRVMNARKLVARNIRRLRVDRGISAEILAADAGIDRAYVSEIERGLGNPTIDMLEKIAGVLRVEIAEFFLKPDPNQPPPRPLRAGRRKH
jgi:transcriptional regulator with XRE-family HTH domain